MCNAMACAVLKGRLSRNGSASPLRLANENTSNHTRHMKLQASAQNVFSMNPGFSTTGRWEQPSSRRSSFTVKPFGSDSIEANVDRQDELTRKQEIVCAVILGLCLLFTFAVCFCQIAGA